MASSAVIAYHFWKAYVGEEPISSGGHKMVMAKKELQELEYYINYASFIVAAGASNPDLFCNWITEARKAAFCLADQISMHAIQRSNEYLLYRMKWDIGMISMSKLSEIIQKHIADIQKLIDDMQSSVITSQLSEISPFIRYSHPVSAGTIIGMDSEIEKVEEFLTGVHPVLFIIGGQGSGKTTLMKHVYEKTRDRGDLNLCYWVDVAKTGGLLGLLKKVLEGSNIDPDAIDEFEIMKTIHGMFQGKRYLIVLDDVQDTSVLYSLKHVLKDLQGKIICLTRRRDIHVLERDTQEVLYISGLKPCHSRMLLIRAAFPDISSIVGDDLFLDARPGFSSIVGDDVFLDALPDFSNIVGDDVLHEAVEWRVMNSPSQSVPADELEETLYGILSKCQDNPWNIWTIGTLIKANPFEKWREIVERIDGMLIDDNIRNEKRDPPIELEDAKLPPAIRDSFLYCLAFPEKSEVLENSGIPTRKLIRLWMAEGYLQDSPFQNEEQQAEGLLQELIKKKLLVVKKKGFDGEVLQCSVNEHIRPLALKMCENQKFCRFVPGDGDEASLSSSMTKFFATTLKRKRALVDRYRMLAVHGDRGVKEASKALNKDTRLRSLLHFKTGRMGHSGLELSFQPRYRLLRTLELQGTRLARLPSTIGCLECLRYLGLRNTQLEDLPPRLQELSYLICLDIRDTNIAEVDDVSAFKDLRHLYLANSFRNQSVLIREGLQSLIYLQKLSGAACGVPSGHQSSRTMVPFDQEILNLKRLRKLSIKKASGESSKNICDAINGMEFLQSLTITCDGEQFDVSSFKIGKNLRKLKLGGDMGKFYDLKPMMQSITYLYLWDSNLPDDPLRTLQGLQHLLLLSLHNTYTGENMSCENGYHKLKKLSIISMENLSQCIFGPEAMRVLEELLFAKCGKLCSPPPGLEQRGSLRAVLLSKMPDEFCDVMRGGSLGNRVHVPGFQKHLHTQSRAATWGS